MRSVRSLWYRYAKFKFISPKYILLLLLLFIIYNEVTNNTPSGKSDRLARDPSHRDEVISEKKRKKLKKLKKMKKKEIKRFEEIESQVSNNYVCVFPLYALSC